MEPRQQDPDAIPVPSAAAVGLELRHLRAFVAVAEELHFTRAAQRLCLAQQALSSQIRQLERMIGAPVFLRTTRSVELAPAGEALLAYAPGILAEVERAWAGAHRVAGEERDQVRIGYTPTVGSITLPAILDALHKEAPGVKVLAHEVWLDEAINGVQRGRFDLAYVRCPPALDGLEVHLVRSEPLSVTLGVDHPMARQDVVHLDDLADSVLALWPRELSPGFYDLVLQTFPRNVAAGLVYEYENFSRAGFLDDPIAREEIAAGRAFCTRLAPAGASAPEGFVYRPLVPRAEVGLHLVRRTEPQRSGPRRPDAAELAVRITGEVATQQGWVRPRSAAAAAA